MTRQDQALTVGAIGFAIFTLLYIRHQQGGSIASSAGEQQRNAGLVQWTSLQQQQQIDAYIESTGIFQSVYGPSLRIGL